MSNFLVSELTLYSYIYLFVTRQVAVNEPWSDEGQREKYRNKNKTTDDMLQTYVSWFNIDLDY